MGWVILWFSPIFILAGIAVFSILWKNILIPISKIIVLLTVLTIMR